jgi:hypothetical protein
MTPSPAIYAVGCRLTSIDPSPVGDSDYLTDWLSDDLCQLLLQHGETWKPSKRVYLPGPVGGCIPTSLFYVVEHPDAQAWLGFALFVVRNGDTRWHYHCLVQTPDGITHDPSRNPRLRLFFGVRFGREAWAALPKNTPTPTTDLPACLQYRHYTASTEAESGQPEGTLILRPK